MRARKPSKEFRFFLYDPEGEGLMYYDSKEERDVYADKCIAEYRDDYDGWCEWVEYLSIGEVTHYPQVTNKQERPLELDENQCDSKGNHWSDDVEWFGNYTMEPV